MADSPDDIVDGVLAHYGVTGMRWGVRKSDAGPGKISRGATKANVALKAGDKVIGEGEQKLIFLPPAKRLKAAGVTQVRVLGEAVAINQSSQFKGKNLKTDASLKKAYFEKVEQAAKKVYAEEIDIARVQAWGDLLGVDTSSTTNIMRLTASSDRIKHADEQEVLLELKLELDDLGQIRDISVLPKYLDHAVDIQVDAVLAHYGVPGMKWGRRKQRDGSVKPSGKKAAEPKSEDAERAATLRKKSVESMSNSELEALTRRLQLEQSYSALAFKQDTREIRKGQDIVKTLLGTAQLAKDVTGVINGAVDSPAASIIREIVKSR